MMGQWKSGGRRLLVYFKEPHCFSEQWQYYSKIHCPPVAQPRRIGKKPCLQAMRVQVDPVGMTSYHT
jgi:hypothetical protein